MKKKRHNNTTEIMCINSELLSNRHDCFSLISVFYLFIIKTSETRNIWNDWKIYGITVCGICRRTRAIIKPAHPTTEAIRASVNNVRPVNRSSQLFNCERNEPVWTVIKVYGAIPKFKKNDVWDKIVQFSLELTEENGKEKCFFWNI
jgi:hypothetical protein